MLTCPQIISTAWGEVRGLKLLAGGFFPYSRSDGESGAPEQPIFGSRPQSTARAEPKHWGCSPFSQRKNPVLLGDLDSYYLLTLEGSDSSIQIFAIQPGGPR